MYLFIKIIIITVVSLFIFPQIYFKDLGKYLTT